MMLVELVDSRHYLALFEMDQIQTFRRYDPIGSLAMEFRKAVKTDLPAIVQMLAEDELGIEREEFAIPIPKPYLKAFEDIEKQDGNALYVAIEDKAVIACLQLTFIPSITRLGSRRAQIEGIRVKEEHRGRGVGEAFIRYAIELARANGCKVVQLTSDNRRVDAHRFYRSMGFTASHAGMKLYLDNELIN